MRLRRVGLIATLALGLLLAPLAADAQAPAKVARLGHLGHGLESGLIEAFREGLREFGYIEGQNIAFEYRYAEGRVERLAELAAELVRLKVDVIVSNGTPATRAAKQATSTIPIVMVGVGLDPVEIGLVASLARPGGNVTGVAALGTELWGKRLELLKETFPRISRVAVLWNPTNPGNALALREMKAVAPAAGVRLQPLEVRDASDFERAFAEIIKENPGALIPIWDAFLLSHARRIADFAVKRRLPTLAPIKEYVDAGALMSYGASIPGQWRRAAYYVDRILKGTKPADLPVEQPTRFELVINLKTARALGLTIPQSILLRADQLIQ
ncbi:MAG: ABC transporter substrate-binding protein [Candidatus Rokubacteria bacterium]|nr:ABC transporter substrate-binding protein [Candidatus Rokubacteria bacterium]